MANYCLNRKVNIVCVCLLTLALGLLSIQRNKIKWNSVLRLKRMYRLHMAKSMVSMQLKAWVSIIAFTLWKIAAVKTQDEGFFSYIFPAGFAPSFWLFITFTFSQRFAIWGFFPSIPLFLTLRVGFFFLSLLLIFVSYRTMLILWFLLSSFVLLVVLFQILFDFISTRRFFSSLFCFFLNFSLLLLLLFSLMSLSFSLLLLQRIKILLL